MKTTIVIPILAVCLIAAPAKAETWLDAYIDSLMEVCLAPGLSAKVIQDGEIIWSGDYGWANIAENRPVEDTTVFGTASVSKTCAAIALMQLWEDSLFQLDDDINDYLPFTVAHWQYPDSAITFRMLMTHTSSIDDNWGIMGSVIYWGGDSPISLREFLEGYLVPGGAYYSTANYHPMWYPGEYYDYTNVGTCLAGYLVEAITEIDYDEYCRENIFTPLGMEETSHFYDQLDTNNVAMPYYYSVGSYWPWGHYNMPWYPSSSLKTSSLQLSNYLTAIMQYGQLGGERILDSTTVVEMLTPQIAFGDTAHQGLFWLHYLGPTTGLWIWGHNGGYYGVSALMWFCQDINSGVVMLSNGDVDQTSPTFYYTIPLPLWNFALSYIPVACTLTPLNPPVIIPPGGGSFDCTIEIENQSDSIAVFDVWIDVTLPNGVMYGPLILRQDVTLPAAGQISRQLIQNVPAGAPAGDYEYNAYVGDYPQYAWNLSSFPFTKEASDDSEMLLADWKIAGWEEQLVFVETPAPDAFALYPAHPNPFNPVATLSFALPQPGEVNLRIYDISGRFVVTLMDGWHEAGHHKVTFDASHLTSGVYVYRLEAGKFTSFGKMVLMK